MCDPAKALYATLNGKEAEIYVGIMWAIFVHRGEVRVNLSSATSVPEFWLSEEFRAKTQMVRKVYLGSHRGRSSEP